MHSALNGSIVYGTPEPSPNALRSSFSCQMLAGTPECTRPKSSGCSSKHRTMRPLSLASFAVLMALMLKCMNSLPVRARRLIHFEDNIIFIYTLFIYKISFLV